MTRVNLIMPTIGRFNEVYECIESIECFSNKSYSTYLQVLDQNNGLLRTLKSYKNDCFYCSVIRSKKRGLSINRNIGIKNIKSGIVAFPDDDCIYYKDTISNVIKYFEDNPLVDVVLGRIYERRTKKNIIKNWPDHAVKINKLNFYKFSSSITIFLRCKPEILFDERLGAGSAYGSCEDPDFLYRLLKKGKRIAYSPTIDIWHPFPNQSTISLKKVFLYARGLGGFIRKDFDLIKFYLLTGCLVKKSAEFIFKHGHFQKGYFRAFFSGLFNGILKFK